MLMILATAALLALQTPLDAPVENKPTVRSEIGKGWRAGESCPIGQSSALRDRCFGAKLLSYEGDHSDFKPFALGLQYARWERAQEAFEVFKSIGSQGATLEANVDRSDALVQLATADHLKDQLGLTDKDIGTVISIDLSEVERWRAMMENSRQR